MSLPWQRPRRWGTSEVMLLFLVACLVNDDLYARMRDKLAAEADSAAQDSAVPADTGEGSDTAAPMDGDGDGYDAAEDCDDADGAVNPGAAEVCNGQDDDCDGDVDVGANDAVDAWRDADGDAWGIGTPEARCLPAEGWVDRGGDCDDGNGNVHPEATERWDGVRNDCEGGAPDQLDTTNADASWTGADTSSDLGRLLAPGPDLDGDGAMGLLIGSMDGGIGRIDVVDGIVRRPDLSMVPRVMGWNGVDAPVWGEFGSPAQTFFVVPRLGVVTTYRVEAGAPMLDEQMSVSSGVLTRWESGDGSGALVVVHDAALRRIVDADWAAWESSSRLMDITGTPSLRAGGDFDDDGYLDLVVGIPAEDRVLVVSGDSLDAERPLLSASGDAGTNFGSLTAALPGASGGLAPQLVVSAPEHVRRSTVAGGVFVFAQRASGTLTAADAVSMVYGRADRDRFGEHLAVCGLALSDPLFVFGIPTTRAAGLDNIGQVYSIPVPTTGEQSVVTGILLAQGVDADDEAGRAVVVDDFDGDAGCDVAFARRDGGRGAAQLYFGAFATEP